MTIVDPSALMEDGFVVLDAPPTNDEAGAPPTGSAMTAHAAPTVRIATAQQEYAARYEHGQVHALVTVTSPELPDDGAGRLPLELVAVVDRSGSMSGSKMKMMKETLDFLVCKGLSSGDALSIVTFDHDVQTVLPLTPMNAENRLSAAKVAKSIDARGQTNLSGGLLQGIDVLNGSARVARETTRAVLLFTDGLANRGITSTRDLLEAMRGVLDPARPTTIFTFGYGSGHNEDMLREVANLTEGLYYFIDSTDDIPQAFSDCLGGLSSVVGQNAQLRIEAPQLAAAPSITRVRGNAKASVDGPKSVSVPLGDLYEDESKDVLLELTLPALGLPQPEPMEALRATLRYFCVASRRMTEVSASVELRRPEEAVMSEVIDARLSEQLVRIEVAAAMNEATAIADQGRVAAGREKLAEAKRIAFASPAAESPFVRELCADLDKCEANFADAVVYRSLGSKAAKMTSDCYAQQRSNHMSALSYMTKGKARMREKWEQSRGEA